MDITVFVKSIGPNKCDEEYLYSWTHRTPELKEYFQRQCFVKCRDKRVLIKSRKQSNRKHHDHLQLFLALEGISRECHVRVPARLHLQFPGTAINERDLPHSHLFFVARKRYDFCRISGLRADVDYLDAAQIRCMSQHVWCDDSTNMISILCTFAVE